MRQCAMQKVLVLSLIGTLVLGLGIQATNSTRTLMNLTTGERILTESEGEKFREKQAGCVTPIEKGGGYRNIDSLPKADNEELVVPDDQPSIQEAINAAKAGDKVFVKAGTYYENIVVNKSISLVGENRATTIIDGRNLSYVVYVPISNVTIQNFTLRNCTLPYPNSGVNIYGDNNTLCDNIVADNLIGVYLYYSHNNTLKGNEVSNCYYGIWADHVSSNNSIIENTILGNRGFGIYAGLDSSNCTIVANTFLNNTYGLGLETENNMVFHNNFVNNTGHAYVHSLGSNWDDGIEGNYWSDYNGSDKNRDGIGDSGYSVAVNNQDEHPLMGEFSEFNALSNSSVNVISNSTIESFDYFEGNRTIKMQVNKMHDDQLFGFCRIRIPHVLMNTSELEVIIDDGLSPVLYQNLTLHDDGIGNWAYFAYEHSAHIIDIVPEFQSDLTILWAMMFLATAVAVYGRKSRVTGTM